MSELPGRKECLVIGPYGTPESPERKWSDWVLRDIVKPVAEEEFGYAASRTIDEPKPGEITARIMGSLRTADLVVADLTGSNPNVYYELALRHATAKPYIHLACEGTQIPFDIKVMNVIEVTQGREADAREQLRKQLNAVKAGRVNFQTDACEPQPRLQAQAYEWEIIYATHFAGEWLKQQSQPVQEAVKNFEDGLGPPAGELLRKALAEYLAYKLAHGTTTAVDLYYTVDTLTRHFSGWGVAPPVEGRGTVTLRVTGYQNSNGRAVELQFYQPPTPLAFGGVEGVVGPFQYTVKFEASQGRPGEFEGRFFHPQYLDILVGRCVLRCKAG